MQLLKTDPQIYDLIKKEQDRQETELNLIASENYTPRSIREATASVLTNKYAEGYPGKRYYGGCAIVDQVETLAIERCKNLFNVEHVNVQSHAGCQANMAAYAALLQSGDTLLGMSLAHGGHLTHGHPVNFSGLWYTSVQYGVNKDTELIDYDEVEKLANQHKPKLIVAGASAYSRFIDFERFAAIAKSVNAYLMVDIAHIAGLIAAGVHPSPAPWADVITSTTHKTLRGPRGAIIMAKKELQEKIDRAIIPGTQGGPFMNVIAAKAVCFTIAGSASFKVYAENVVKNAHAMADYFKNNGYRIVADGTDNHLFIVDLRPQGLTGKKAEQILESSGISISRSCIPFDQEKPWITSGIRLGTPAITTRGMGQNEAVLIASFIDQALKSSNDDRKIAAIKGEIETLCKTFSLKEW